MLTLSDFIKLPEFSYLESFKFSLMKVIGVLVKCIYVKVGRVLPHADIENIKQNIYEAN